jgi:uncharacterized protein (DUF2267 family)
MTSGGGTQLTNPDVEARRRLVRSVATRAALPVQVTAEAATAAVMCALTQRLTTGQANALVQALPPPVATLFGTCVQHRVGPVSGMRRPEMLEAIAAHLGVSPARAEAICRAVLSAVRDTLPPEVAANVVAQLPADLGKLWQAGTEPPESPVIPPDEIDRLRARAIAEIERGAPDLPQGIDGAAALSAVMCIFSQRISGGKARRMFLALPASLRSFVDTCMLHRGEPPETFSRDELLLAVAAHLGTDTGRAEPIVRSVLRAMRNVLPAQDVDDAASQLPNELRALWLADGAAEPH